MPALLYFWGKKERQSMIKDLFKDMTKYLPSKVIPAIVGIVALPIITRLFSPADYRNYVLVIATVSILSTLAG